MKKNGKTNESLCLKLLACSSEHEADAREALAVLRARGIVRVRINDKEGDVYTLTPEAIPYMGNKAKRLVVTMKPMFR